MVEHSHQLGSGYRRTTAFITDAELAADLLERLVEREEKALAKLEADRSAGGKGDSGGAGAGDPAKEEPRWAVTWNTMDRSSLPPIRLGASLPKIEELRLNSDLRRLADSSDRVLTWFDHQKSL